MSSPSSHIFNQIGISFELFPPKTEALETKLLGTLGCLAQLNPRFFSVTYGAGGATRERTQSIVQRLQTDTGVAAAAHLTCVAATRDEVDEIARGYWDAGIRHIVALRGDPVDGTKNYTPHPDGYNFALDLVAGLKRIADFEITVAAYPEVHPEAISASTDLDNLKRKVDAGADRAITQFFFEPEVFLAFRERVAAAGIDIPLVPGILPVTNFAQVQRFASMCGATVPLWLADLFADLDDQPEAREQISVATTTELCSALIEGGVRDLHFYTLNRTNLPYAICQTLGLTPDAKQQMSHPTKEGETAQSSALLPHPNPHTIP